MEGNAALAEPVAAAMRNGDFTALRDALAPEVVLVSPITGSFRFEGRDDVLELLMTVRRTFDDYEYVDVLGGDRAAAVRFRARVGDQPVEGVDLMSFDDGGSVREMTVFIRPLPGLTAVLGALAPQIARPNGHWRAVLARLLTRPLVAITRGGDRVAGRLVGRV